MSCGDGNGPGSNEGQLRIQHFVGECGQISLPWAALGKPSPVRVVL